MLTRRHIRVKVMQSLYAMGQSKSDNLDKEKKFLNYSMERMYDLLLINLQLLVAVRKHAEDYMTKSQKKHLATSEEKNPNAKFINNAILIALENNMHLKDFMTQKNKNPWILDSEYVAIIWKSIVASDSYKTYMETTGSSFKEDKDFVIHVFKELVAPNEQLYDYYEDTNLTWVDDLPLINTALVKFIKKMKPTQDASAKLPSLYKDVDDKKFAEDLITRTALNAETFGTALEGKTPNWDKDRIADLDRTMIQMAICEFLKFSSIPVKVTINEYLEIAKEYSTPKSSIFINGILDKLSKEYAEKDQLNKMGRGLM